ncbi:MAG: substrate-binding domain-containing protein [bacterium]|nr:substrate-binding domain-containing protein [bacterium]
MYWCMGKKKSCLFEENKKKLTIMEDFTMKKSLFWMLLVLFSLSLAPVSVLAEGEKGPMDGWVVGYLPGSLKDNVRIRWSNALEERVKEAGAKKFVVIDSQLDTTKQVSDGEDILQMGINILVMNPNDADAMIPIVEKANEMGIPVICIDRTTNGGDVISTVGLDNWQLGEGSAQFIVEKLTERYGEPKGKVLHLQGSLGASVVFERGESFRQVLKNYPDIEIVGEPSSSGWTAGDGLAFTEDTLAAHPDLDALYTHTDAITMGAFNAVEAAGKLDQVIIVGQNYYGGIPDIVKEGKYLVYDWALDAAAIGYETGNICIKVARGRLNEIPKKIGIPNFFVTPENTDEYWHLNLDLPE